MTTSEVEVLGTTAEIVKMFEGTVSVGSMYEASGAAFYHNLSRGETAEIEEIVAAARGVDTPILELACGSGRITVPLLQAGHSIVGLDFSESMLELLATRVREQDATPYADQLETVYADMTSFDLGRTFDLVFLAASAIWNVDEAQRASLFSSVREHLTPDGRFLFTLIEFAGVGADTESFETQITFAADYPENKALVTFLDFVEPSAKRRSTNVVAQNVRDGSVTSIDVYTALTHLVSPEALENEIEQAGMRVIARSEITSGYNVLKTSAHPFTVQLLEVGR